MTRWMRMLLGFHGHQVLEKGGALDGVRTVTDLVPDLKLGVTVLANRNLTALPEAVRAFMLERYLGASGPDTQEQIQAADATFQTLIQPVALPANPEPMSAPLSSYAGTYVNPVYGSFVLTPDGDGLRVEAGPGKYQGKLTHYSRDTFVLTWQHLNEGSEEVTFTLGPSGQAIRFDSERLGSFVQADAVGSPPTP